ncbi:MAG TPA: FAD:protein FMN transferase [Candidatus Paceibacterota bacterium]|nr:FAD:protein FMN transferase [Candidatus Paceibacterota bacterium]
MQEFDYEKNVMGSEASISIVTDSRAHADATAATLFAIAEREEARFSRFRPESELSLLNKERSRSVSPECLETVLLGRDLYRASSGLFNPLVAIARFGYDADIAEVKGRDRTGNSHDAYSIDMESVGIDEKTRTVFLQEGQTLDTGGYTKGHTAQLMAEAAVGCQGVLVNLGGDIYARGLDAEGKPFVFHIDNPKDSSMDLSFFVTNAGIATSGSYNRTWMLEGKPFFHILDASGTKNPVTDIVSATVIAPSGAEADAFATVALVAGVQAAECLLEEEGYEYCFITTNGSIIFSGAFPLVENAESYLYV